MHPVLLVTIVLLVVALVAVPAAVVYLRRRRGQPPAAGEPRGPGAPALDALAPGPTDIPGALGPVAPALHGLRPVPPIVLVHGILGFDHFQVLGRRLVYFRGIADMLRMEGATVYAARLPPLAAVPQRAHALAAFVRSLPHDHVHLVAHSMGGLDARYALSRLGLHERVSSLVTIATPHHGTPLADLGGAAPVRALRGLVGRVGLRSEAVDWLTTEGLARFNRHIRDAPGVRYGCVVGRSTREAVLANPVLLSGHVYLSLRAGDNDGMVPSDSQGWGEIVDDIDADHWAQIGWSRYFDATSMYLRLYRALYDDALARESTG